MDSLLSTKGMINDLEARSKGADQLLEASSVLVASSTDANGLPNAGSATMEPESPLVAQADMRRYPRHE